MRYFRFVFPVFLLLNLHLFAQYVVEGTVKGGSGLLLKMGKYAGDKITVVDSAVCSPEGRFRLQIAKETPEGQFRIISRNHGGFDFFFHSASLSLTTDIQALADSLYFINSEPNNDWNAFRKYENRHQRMMEMLTPLLDNYPVQQAFYQEVVREYVFQQVDFGTTLNQLSGRNSQNIVGRYLLTRRLPRLDPGLLPEQRLEFLRENMLMSIPLQDSLLIHTNAYTKFTIQYLSLYSNPSLDKAGLESAFIDGLKILMDSFESSGPVYDQITGFLLDGFTGFGFEEVVQFISERYQLEKCSHTSPGLAERIALLRTLVPGLPAPEIGGKDLKGQEISLNGHRGKYVLLVFWASWCPHCNEILPKIHEVYSRTGHSAWQVITFAIDEKAGDAKKLIQEKGYTWISVADGKGWDTPAALSYGIAATPTFVFVGPDGNILAKPSTFYEISALLTEYGLAGKTGN